MNVGVYVEKFGVRILLVLSKCSLAESVTETSSWCRNEQVYPGVKCKARSCRLDTALCKNLPTFNTNVFHGTILFLILQVFFIYAKKLPYETLHLELHI